MPAYKTAIHDARRRAHEVLCGVLALDVAGDAGLLLYVLDADELVGDGVDDEAGGAVYLQLLRYVAAVGGHGVHREAEGVGNLFVAQPFGDTDEDVLLAVAQEVRPVAGVLTVSCHAEHREASRNVPWQSPCARSLTSAPSAST